MNALRCSVVIPTRNRAAFLEKCLSALARQEIGPDEMEIIVVDDGSTDDTSERARSAEPLMPFKLRVLKGEGRGPAAARNLGWRAARAPIILFTDDDCEPSPSWAGELVAFLEKHEHHSGVGGETRRIRDSLTARYTDFDGCMNHPGDPANVDYLVTSNAAYRRAVLEKVGGFSERFPCAGGEDPELSFRIRAQGMKMGKTREALVLHNHPCSLVGLYQMYFRYGRGEFGLAALGEDWCRSRGDVKRLLHEWRCAFAFYRRQHGLSVSDRLIFGAFGMMRCYAMFLGYRYQAKNSAQ
jgi:glycosyltransferase involved in cell wall biosynthesis